MTLHAALTHKTLYRYDRPISMGPHIIRLRPAPHCRTPILSYSLKLTPETHFLNWQQDPFGNFLARVVLPEKTPEFSVTVDVVADMAVINPFDFFIADEAKDWPFRYAPALAEELSPYLKPDPAGPLLAAFVQGIDRTPRVTLDFICDLNREIQKKVGYTIRMEPGVQTPEETLETCTGSCRDSGWLLVQVMRHFGLAARFVSGYLIQLTPDVKPLDGPAGTSVDFTDLHAWCEVYVSGAGWIGLDPTSGLLAGEGHIPLAATPRPSSAAPISGAHERAEVDFNFDMRVVRIRETPRTTKPYTEDTWQRILAAGDAVDKHLTAGDVRLSMGGEPTFVSADDMEAAEWNTAAVGPTKRGYAETLTRRLRDRFAPGGLLHYGQGKWYPGEQLPRWAFAIYWRADGEPLWVNHDLIAKENPAKPATVDDASTFAAMLCAELGFPADSGMPAYEDAAHFALVEQKLPINLTAATNKLADEAERARIIKVFDQGLLKQTGVVLPVQSWQSKDGMRRWVTEKWTLRRGKLFLMPGDSPAGLRLPLGALPAIPVHAQPHVLPHDQTAGVRELPDRRRLLDLYRLPDNILLQAPQPRGLNEIEGSVRTAMAIEPRDGKLCVFMPPLEDGSQYAALVAAIEETAAKCGQPVHIEGYTPPSDARLNVIKVTPDPGVIEVNIQPATSWQHAVEITTTLYDEAQLTRLATEKFMADGRHTGTGGGNHIVLGGMTPADSPFLRRPDLLASIIAYWQNHPSLSYLFSGLFIGPTSQAPRSDEGRHESLYELEIALSQVPGPGEGTLPPWLVDRLFRNLLIDVTGNTHRAEICIDKLYSPDGPAGRLGLVEFRSFEMPPHARMSLAQQLLLRALVAMFWDRPYKASLVRWGTALHDRFMLPHYVWSDLADVISDLKAAGLPMELNWFVPHFEFRFPKIGSIETRHLHLEIRQALEPWHVLGEEGAPGGTARYVDSSLERLQVKLSGAVDQRFVVTCNGRALALHSTGTFGEGVSGVRYRAWWPPSALHPTIKPHVPLTFDIADTWTGRSIAGCRYHVAHPGGRNLETFPINSYEAEGRRLARFEQHGHTAGIMSLAPPAPNADYPMTLDLRRPS